MGTLHIFLKFLLNKKYEASPFLLLFSSLIFQFSSLSLAVPPPPGFIVPTQPICKVNPGALAARSAALKAAPFFPPPLAATAAYVVVIRVDFSDQAMSKTKTDTEAFMQKLKEFYLENSYGLLTVNATVTNRIAGGSAGAEGSYRLPQTLASYGQGICSNFSDIAQDAVSAVGADLNFANGAPGGNRFSHIMIYHAGIGAETANDSGCATDNIWSVFAPTVAATADKTTGVRINNVANSTFDKNGVGFNGVTIVPESEGQSIDPLGVICHEYGHQLGLPDLYAASAQTVVGKWSLMDSGVYIGSPLGSNPSHLDAWSKKFLGFSSPQLSTLTESAQTISLGYAVTARAAFLRVPISGVQGVDGDKEYFLVERRGSATVTGKNFDNALPLGSLPEGYLIWHVDDNIALNEGRLQANTVNSGAPNLGVDLVEAAGGGAIAATAGKESDPFPGSRGKTLFATPLSNSFGGQQSGIALAGFSGSVLVAKKAFGASSVEVAKTINFPNPGGPSYTQRSGAPSGTVTTIVVHATRPPQTIFLTIHDLTGALVRDVPESLIRANGLATATNKFVFEYDWDGKNDSGEPAAPGIYLYRFKADDKVVGTGKLVIVR